MGRLAPLGEGKGGLCRGFQALGMNSCPVPGVPQPETV